MSTMPATWREYDRIVRRITARMAAGGEGPGMVAGHSRSTRALERTAWRWQARINDEPEPVLDEPDTPPPRKRRSKRASVGDLPRGWVNELVYHARTSKYRDEIMISILTGCRPSDLAHGARVIHIAGTGVTRIYVKGAKVKDEIQAGQPDRFVDVTDPRARSIRAGRHRIESPDSYRSIIARLIKRIAESASAYTLRHAFGTSQKTSGMDPDDVSRALGHRSDRTRRRYGHGKGGRGIEPSTIVGVGATHPIRHTASPVPGAKPRRLKPR